MDAAATERVFRESSGRAVATLVRFFGDIDLAEEAVQEAFAVAIERWPADGIPDNPGGWIVTAARNKARDRLRRESSRFSRQTEATRLRWPAPPGDAGPPEEVEAVPDDRLRLIFTCCHPALNAEAQLALTLRRSTAAWPGPKPKAPPSPWPNWTRWTSPPWPATTSSTPPGPTS